MIGTGLIATPTANVKTSLIPLPIDITRRLPSAFRAQ
jgi:hypothetical protein